MMSKTSLFNGTLFRKTVCRLWPLWVGYLALWVLILPVPMGSALVWTDTPDVKVTRDVLSAAIYGAPLVSLFAGILSAMGAFSFLYKTGSASAYGALPIRREGVFLSQTLAGLVPLLVMNAVTALITLLVEVRSGHVAVPYLAQWLGYTCLYTLCFYGFGVLCAQLTGSLLILPCVYMILSFTAVVVEWLSRKALSLFVYGLAAATESLSFLSPAYYAVFFSQVLNVQLGGGAVGYEISGWGSAAVCGAAGLVCLAGALLLFRRRRLETAGDVVALRPLKPVFKYCLAFGCSLCLCMLVYFITDRFSYPFPEVLGLMLLGGFAGYFAALMLMKKSFRVFRGNWLGFIIYSAVLAALLTAVRMDAFGYVRYVPETESVSSVSVAGFGQTGTFSERENVDSARALHQYMVDSRDANRGGLGRRYYGSGPVLTVRYTLTDGRRVERQYMVRYDTATGGEAASRLTELLNTAEGVAGRGYPGEALAITDVAESSIEYTTDGAMDEVFIEKYGDAQVYSDVYTLSREETAQLYNQCILPDLREGALGQVWLLDDGLREESTYSCTIVINVRDYGGGANNYRTYTFTPSPASQRTNAWLTAHGIPLKTWAEWTETLSPDA